MHLCVGYNSRDLDLSRALHQILWMRITTIHPQQFHLKYMKSSHYVLHLNFIQVNHSIKVDESFWRCIRSQRIKQTMHADIYGITHKYRPTG